MKSFGAIFLPLLIAYSGVLRWCVDRWNAPTEYFAHCWLVPFVAMFVIWGRRDEWRSRPCVLDLSGLWLLIPGLILHLAGSLLMIDSWSAASIALAFPGAAWLALGRQRMQGLWPVMALVLFAIPLPIYVEGRIAFVLKEIAVQGGSAIANLLGADVVRNGDRLTPQGASDSLYVADACGGLRSLMAMLTLSYCLAFFSGPPNKLRRLTLLVAAAPLAICANVARIAALCLLAKWFGVPFAESTGHSVANVMEWVTLLLALVALDGLLQGRVAKTSATVSDSTADSSAALLHTTESKSALRKPAVILWLLAVPLFWLSDYRPLGERFDRAKQLPETIAGFQLEARTATAQIAFKQSLPRYRELLGTSDFVWRRYRNQDKHLINLVALFHDTNWKSVHPPRICIEGSNMTIERDDMVDASWLAASPSDADGILASRIVAKSRASNWRYVTLSVFGTQNWASGDYAEFTWHHLPLALVRQNESGFLLRVESPIYSGEDIATAEARCREFLKDLMPAARKLLR